MGTKDLILDEYASMLSEKLLAIFEFDDPMFLVQEETVIEFMKRKFGEFALSSVEVMLKDMRDSKRIRTWQDTLKKDSSVRFLHININL